MQWGSTLLSHGHYSPRRNASVNFLGGFAAAHNQKVFGIRQDLSWIAEPASRRSEAVSIGGRKASENRQSGRLLTGDLHRFRHPPPTGGKRLARLNGAGYYRDASIRVDPIFLRGAVDAAAIFEDAGDQGYIRSHIEFC